ncbi:MAG TPA: GTP 3',8-cyclase MoaA [Polyangiaceae bacterium]|nr:GTP 3',8-cyclase MoaA [Polyangiaceae bacterium]
MNSVRDQLGRSITDLRVSVTDRCNFRCRYCMPREHFDQEHRYLPRAGILSFEEIQRVVSSLAPLGLRKVRLTGGEPLLRSELHKLVTLLLRARPELEIALTTNGSLLAKQAQALRDAGLSRLTVSLDSLSPEVFARMTDSELPVTDVLAGIEAAHRVGFGPIKINAVVRRGINDGGIVELARHFKGSGDIVRFIEYMDVGLTNGWRTDQVLSGREIVARIGAEMPLEPASANYAGEVAKRYRYLDGSGEIGVITSVTQPFCGDCGRLRLSADGQIFGCLFARVGTDLRALLRASTDDAELSEKLAAFWRARDDRYSELRSAGTRSLPRLEMSYLGG